MIKKVFTLLALTSVFVISSCRNKDEFAEVRIDANNMIAAQDSEIIDPVVEAKNVKKVQDYPKMEIEGNGEFDFGVINEGDKVEHIFKFKNLGKTDLLVVHAQASCGCTVPEWTKQPIKPGEFGEIKIVFNSTGKPGEQRKTVTLTTNTESGHELINFKANVTPKAK